MVEEEDLPWLVLHVTAGTDGRDVVAISPGTRGAGEQQSVLNFLSIVLCMCIGMHRVNIRTTGGRPKPRLYLEF